MIVVKTFSREISVLLVYHTSQRPEGKSTIFDHISISDKAGQNVYGFVDSSVAKASYLGFG